MSPNVPIGSSQLLAELAETNLNGQLKCDKQFIQSPSKSCLQYSKLCGLYTRWICKINPKYFGNVPSGVLGYFKIKIQLMHQCVDGDVWKRLMGSTTSELPTCLRQSQSGWGGIHVYFLPVATCCRRISLLLLVLPSHC